MVTGETGVNVYDRETTLALLKPGEQVIAVDPGDSTGIAVLWRTRDNRKIVHFYTLVYEQVLRFLDEENDEYKHRDWLDSIQYVVERFVTRPGRFAKQQYAGKVCGAVDMLCEIHAINVTYQDPATMKTMLPDVAALKAGGWSWSSKHEQEALLHAIYFLHTR